VFEQRQAQIDIDDAWKELEKVYDKYTTATDAATYTALDNDANRLNELISDRYSIIDGISDYMRTLDEADAEHQKYLDDVARQAREKELAENQTAIAGLEALKTDLAALKTQAAAAKAAYEAANPATRPSTWSAEDETAAITAEGAFFDLEKQVKDLQRTVNEGQKLKDAFDAEVAAQEAKFTAGLQGAIDARPGLISAHYDARADFEENRLYPGVDPEYINQLRMAYDNAKHAD
jgi:hypothetical protein